MKSHKTNLFAAVFLLILISSNALPANWKIEFWDIQRKGANGDGGSAKEGGANPEDWFEAATIAGLDFVRLCPGDWDGQGRDFLIGNADHYTTIPEEDIKKLKAVLDIAHSHRIKVVLTMFSLPGARYRQDNNNQFDYRLWSEESYQEQALKFWKDISSQLKDHPAVVGYNPLNEPYPSRKDGFAEEGETEGFQNWLLQNKDTVADLNRFNRRVVEAIRLEDSETPIILDCWFHSHAEGFRYLKPLNDKSVIYAFHYYGNWEFATFRINDGRFSYPDRMPAGDGKSEKWTQKTIEEHLKPVADWARQHQIPASRIIAEEFGCDRRVSGAKEFLSDLIKVLNNKKWHWAFYSFRSSTWDGLDYELGTKPLGWEYWQGREKGVDHESLINRHDNLIWNIFKGELAR